MNRPARRALLLRVTAVTPPLVLLCACSTPTPQEVVIRTTGAAQNVTRMTQSTEDEIDPVVSPDGSRLAFETVKNGQFDILTIDTATGRARVQVTKHPSDDIHPAWTPDGQSLVFASNRLGTFKLWRKLASGGGGATMITRGNDMIDFAPSVSADGKTICFTSRGAGVVPVDVRASGAAVYTSFRRALPYIWTVSSSGTDLTQFGEGVTPTWSSDGTRIAFCSDVSGNWDIWSMGTSGESLTQVTMDPADQMSPCFSPDGQWIAYVSNESGNDDLWIMKADGSFPTQLTTDQGEEAAPSWGADGNLYFCSRKAGNWDIWRLTPVLPQ